MQFDTGHRASEGLRVSTLARWHSAYEQFQDSLLCSVCSIPILKGSGRVFQCIYLGKKYLCITLMKDIIVGVRENELF